MLLFQQDLRQPQHEELKWLLLYSGIAHIILVSAVFIISRKDHIRISLSQPLDDALVVVMPLYKNIPLNKNVPIKKGTVAQRTVSGQASHREFHSASAYVPQKNSARTVQSSHIVREPVVARRTKNVHDIKPDMQGTKFVRKKIERKIEDNSPPAQQKNNELQAPEQTSAIQTTTEKQVIYIGRDDAQQLQEIQDICNAILPHWCAPVGCATNAECEIVVTIDKQGLPAQVLITKSSGALAFDYAARAAILRSKFPSNKWGSTMTLLFG